MVHVDAGNVNGFSTGKRDRVKYPKKKFGVVLGRKGENKIEIGSL